MIQIPAAQVEFSKTGNTIWVHGPIGATILRIKTLGKIITNGECENVCSHSDIVVKDDIDICLSDDAQVITDLERMKQTFDLVGIKYIEHIDPPDENGVYATLLLHERQVSVYFGFLDGKFVSDR